MTRPTAEAGAVEPVATSIGLPPGGIVQSNPTAPPVLHPQSVVDALRAQLEAAEAGNHRADDSQPTWAELTAHWKARAAAAEAEAARLGRELSAVEFAIEECTRNGEIPYCIESVWAGVIAARTKEAAP